ncbi:MAG: hypothetical protein EOO68_24965, partial [Moraxellaceae bacterium]
MVYAQVSMKILESLQCWLKATRHWLYPLIALALAALVYEGVAKLLKRLDLHQVWMSMQNTPPEALALALLATVISYIALMGYDFGSLRLVGAKIPAKKTAKTAFMAYALGNSLGAGMLTGGALRMRHYMAEGASAGQVTRAIVINALSFGLGIGVLGALGILWQSDKVEEVIHLPAVLLKVLAVLFLTTLGLWGVGSQCMGETIPKETNYVNLDANQKDEWGIPLINFNVSYDDNDEKMIKDFIEQYTEMYEKAGFIDIKATDSKQAPGLDIHEMGGVRMGRDKKTSLLNKWNQLHE